MLGWAKHLRSSKHLQWQNGFSSRSLYRGGPLQAISGLLSTWPSNPPRFVMTWGARRAPDDVIIEGECVDPLRYTGFGVTLALANLRGDPVIVEDRTKHHERSTRNGLPSLRSSGEGDGACWVSSPRSALGSVCSKKCDLQDVPLREFVAGP